MADKLEHHWGRWLQARASFVGFKRQQDVAEAVGCTPQHLSMWYRSEYPPKNMRKGFDWKLAWALKTTPEILFRDWENTPANQARKFIFPRPEGRPPPDPEFFLHQQERQELEEMLEGFVVPNLSYAQLEELVGIGLVLAALGKGPIMGHMLRELEMTHPLLQKLHFLVKPKVAGNPDTSTADGVGIIKDKKMMTKLMGSHADPKTDTLEFVVDGIEQKTTDSTIAPTKKPPRKS